MKLATVFRSISKKMKGDFEDLSPEINHPTMKGDYNEEKIRAHLKNYLPEKYGIGEGLVLASNKEKSRQQDIIIYDRLGCPLLLNEKDAQVFPAESVYSVIEVKSKLDKNKLKNCIEKVKSVRTLPKSEGERHLGQSIVTKESSTPTGGYVFAYSAKTRLDTLRNNLNELNTQMRIKQKERIHTICILEEGLITPFAKNSFIIGDSDTPYEVLSYRKDSLLWFYIVIMSQLGISKVATPNLLVYAQM